MRNVLKPKGHWIQSQAVECLLGLALVLIGCVLVWDASDNRGRKLPWPVSGLAPWLSR
jgi:hypothetical protein